MERLSEEIRGNIHRVKERIAQAALRAGRDPDEIKLVAVSKSFGLEHIRAAIAAGITILGENKVQEAHQKIPHIEAEVSWHMVGHLQSNKAKRAAELFDTIHSIDRLSIAEKLNRHLAALSKRMEVLIQVDLAGEEAKFGTAEGELEELVKRVREMENLTIKGLMIMPPFFSNPEDVRPYFQRLRQLVDQLNRKGVVPAELKELSMGMSHDFEVAIEEGATMVRVGTAVFGPREE
ncbi:MAG: YggS family pyridoxal phosphate-dependent enzyme [Candidatus Aminicenantes bacterium]|nr:YggS family pyridoxal phosphate-dependent enzyme [Candidatus Aminicenantes bacterium]MDH5715226.1 YggS family pyridoxal phosphate-dependent enzyme [Candidatus Aminicenantes bacterium]